MRFVILAMPVIAESSPIGVLIKGKDGKPLGVLFVNYRPRRVLPPVPQDIIIDTRTDDVPVSDTEEPTDGPPQELSAEIDGGQIE